MNKTVIMTGGSSGIGKATVENFAKEAYHVIFSGRNKEKDLSQNLNI